jgi:hypothetical protein
MVTLAILAVVFMSGAVAGVLVLICTSIKREDSRNSLYETPPNRAAAGTRKLVGWYGTQTAPASRPHRAAGSERRPRTVAASAR